ncbi:UNVERIFIED_CONTAM: hypothetical protein RKD50_002157 [Streptomyces canus]
MNVDLFVHGALIVLDLNTPRLRPLHDPWSTLGYAALDERAVIADQEALV